MNFGDNYGILYPDPNSFHVLVRWINQTENIRDVYGVTIFVKIKISRCWKNDDFCEHIHIKAF